MSPLHRELDFYRQMLRIRMVEERLIELYRSGEVRSLMHLSTGQEAVAVGVSSALNKEDSVVSTHRCHAHYLAKGGSLKKMFAELAGKKDGCSGGKGGSMHLFDLEVGMNLSVPLVAGSIPIAVGIAQAIKLKGEQRVSVTFFGDGAVEEGVFWESLNYAVVQRLPVIFVCENNLYATHSHISKRQSNVTIATAGSLANLSVQVDGNNVLAVAELANSAVENVRAFGGPVFIEAKTYRWKEHWGPGEDWHLGYRSEAEGQIWKDRCPIQNLRTKLIDSNVEGQLLDSFAEEIRLEIAEAVQFAKESPEPEEEELLTW